METVIGRIFLYFHFRTKQNSQYELLNWLLSISYCSKLQATAGHTATLQCAV